MLGIDSVNVRGLLASVRKPVMTYGVAPDADLRAEKIVIDGLSTRFEVIRKGESARRGDDSDAGRACRAELAGGNRGRAGSWELVSTSRRAALAKFSVASAGASRSRARRRDGSCSTTTRIIRRKFARRWRRRARRSNGAWSRSFSRIAIRGCAICSTNF